MFKTILAATDHVTESDPVVETAARLAAANHCRLCILHVLESASLQNRRLVKHYATGEEIKGDMDYKADIQRQLLAAHQEAIHTAPVSHVHITTGYPWEEILRLAHQADADLIALGPHSGRALQKGVVRVVGKVGSTAEGVIRREKCPVMIVNPDQPKVTEPFKRILVGIDFSAACECALCFSGQLARSTGAKVLVFHMIPIPPYPKYTVCAYKADEVNSGERLIYFCREYLEGADWAYRVKGGVQPHRELLHFANQEIVDLIVLGSHTRQSKGKWYPGSAVERVSYHSKCPVMVINDPEALSPWRDMQASLGKTQDLKNRHIHVFTDRTRRESYP
jgi:nucleotide-binding universal stress UspA family protein